MIILKLPRDGETNLFFAYALEEKPNDCPDSCRDILDEMRRDYIGKIRKVVEELEVSWQSEVDHSVHRFENASRLLIRKLERVQEESQGTKTVRLELNDGMSLEHTGRGHSKFDAYFAIGLTIVYRICKLLIAKYVSDTTPSSPSPPPSSS